MFCYSDFFKYSVGLRQVGVISPILVSLYVEDIELYLQAKIESGLVIDDIVLILLLFADAMVLYGNSPEDLQNSLNLLQSYSIEWGFEVNCSKIKVVVLKNGEVYYRLKNGLTMT